MSLLEFKAIHYKRRGNAVADDEQLARIVKVPKREFIRRRINQHTLEKICRRDPVRVAKLAKVLKVLEELESGRNNRGEQKANLLNSRCERGTERINK